MTSSFLLWPGFFLGGVSRRSFILDFSEHVDVFFEQTVFSCNLLVCFILLI